MPLFALGIYGNSCSRKDISVRTPINLGSLVSIFLSNYFPSQLPISNFQSRRMFLRYHGTCDSNLRDSAAPNWGEPAGAGAEPPGHRTCSVCCGDRNRDGEDSGAWPGKEGHSWLHSLGACNHSATRMLPNSWAVQGPSAADTGSLATSTGSHSCCSQ